MDAVELLWLAGSLVLLTVGAELLVLGAVALAEQMGVSSFFIGLTIVGFGTSTPELSASLTAALRGQDDLAVGNVVGSNTFNIAVILGLTALLRPIPVRLAAVRGDVWAAILVATTPWIAYALGGRVERWLGALFLAALAAYLVRGYRAGRAEHAAASIETVEHAGLEIPRTWHRTALEVGLLAGGLVLLVLGSRLLVDSASAIARGLGVSELAIGLTVVAAGTSAPELVTSLVAAFRRQSDVAIGNVLGSNVFNLIGILGATSVVAPQRISPQVAALDAPVMFAASLALLPIVATGARISRTEGIALLAGYLVYLWVLFEHAPRWF